MVIYINGDYLPRDRAFVSVFDRGFLLGDGIFETIRAYDGKIFKLKSHLDRLFRSAASIQLSIPHTREEFRGLLYQVLGKNQLKDALIRITITRGEGEVGLILPPPVKPTVVILPRPFAGYPDSSYEKGVKIVTIEGQLHSPSGPHPSIKSTSFLYPILAKMQARQKDADDGVLLDRHGNVAEGTTSNLFLVKEGRLITPSAEAGILKGVTRQTVMELARDKGISVQEALFSCEDLYQADECFLTNTGFEIMPVVTVDGRGLGSGHPGPLTILLRKAFREAVQEMIHDEIW
jgi:branched-chain amino acid aminotransferase